jgi:hypothetical protein
MKSRNLTSALDLGAAALDTEELIKRLLITLAAKKSEVVKESRRNLFISSPDETSHFNGTFLQAQAMQSVEVKARPKSADSSTTDASETTNSKAYSGDDVSLQYLESAFKRLVADNRRSGGSRNIRGQPEVMSCCVKQFFLDSSVCSALLWLAMGDSLSKRWVNFSDLVRSFEVLRLIEITSARTPLRELRLKRQSLNLQKLLSKVSSVHFKLIEASTKGPLTVQELRQVVKMTLHKYKPLAVNDGVHKILIRLHDRYGKDVEEISFSDFYHVVQHRR